MYGDIELYIIIALVSLIAGFIPGVIFGVRLTRGHVGGVQAHHATPPLPRRTRVLRGRAPKYEEDDYYR
jgi:hypothetical protein